MKELALMLVNNFFAGFSKWCQNTGRGILSPTQELPQRHRSPNTARAGLCRSTDSKKHTK